MNPVLQPNPEVRDALANRLPIVALESTMLTHGLPPHRRRDVATKIEDAVRSAGAVPATMLVVDGVVHVGLDEHAFDRLESPEPIQKASIDQLPHALATGIAAATTVSSSIAIAAAAGIEVFSTGGLGGVHRGAGTTFDISGDLRALATYSVVVVTAGVKSILDVPATLEVLETLGVSVLTLGTDAFPAYYISDSGSTATRIDDAAIAAHTLTARRALSMTGSVLLACPPPLDHCIDPAEHERLLAAGLEEAAATGTSGADITPILLRHLAAASSGRTGRASVAITIANAAIAAVVAQAMK